MLITTLLVDEGEVFDLELHEERLKKGCEERGYAWRPLALPQVEGRARLRITMNEEQTAYHVEKTAPYCSTPLHLLIKEDLGLRCKTTESALRRSWGDMMTVNAEGYVLQASCANLFWVHEGEFMTPCFERLPIIKGTCLTRMMQHFPIKQVLWNSDELLSKTPHLFICNAIREIVPVGQVEMTPFSVSYSLLDQILGQYRKIRYSSRL